jgi:hypothetical protein
LGLDDLRIVVAHGGRTNDDVRLSNVVAAMTFEDFNTHFLEPIRDGGTPQVGTRDAKAEIDQHLGNAGHADAPDTDEMDVLNSAKHTAGLGSLYLVLCTLYLVLCTLCFLCLFAAQFFNHVYGC